MLCYQWYTVNRSVADVSAGPSRRDKDKSRKGTYRTTRNNNIKNVIIGYSLVLYCSNRRLEFRKVTGLLANYIQVETSQRSETRRRTTTTVITDTVTVVRRTNIVFQG